MTVYQSTTIQAIEQFKQALWQLCQDHQIGLVPDVTGDHPYPFPDDGCLCLVPMLGWHAAVKEAIDYAAVNYTVMEQALKGPATEGSAVQ